MDGQQFLKKNIRYISLIILALFFIKSFQSCNRNMEVKKLNKEITHLSDSLTNMYDSKKVNLYIELQEAKDSIKELNYLVKLAESEKNAAEKRADAVQSTAEKIRENTTIKIENYSGRDTLDIIK